MYITLETDYAVRIVSVLCVEKTRIDAKTISDKTSVTLRFALKILRKLVASGIVKSFKGTQGGYQINLDPSEITLRMVVEAIEGTYSFSRCLLPDGICSRDAKDVCCYRKAFFEVSEMVRDKLESFNFADLIANSEEFKGLSDSNDVQEKEK